MAHIKIGMLGGLDENGKNMAVVEVNDHIFILDAGLRYPDVDMYGVDAVVPDMNYLIENKERIMGVFISHGHEDHIGALPYLLENVNVPVFGTHFTICLIENLLSESNMNIKKYKLYRINDNKILTFDDITVTFFNTTHSIPESVGISINTSDGSIVYLTDFTFNFSSGLKYQTSFDKITDLGKNGVLVAMVESLGSTSIGRIANDKLLEHAYSKILAKNGRIILSAFSSDLSRIQKIIDMSVKAGRKIAIVGRRAQKIINIAINSGYLEIPQNYLVNLKFIDDENDNNDSNLVVIVTGIRQEPYSILMRMASGQDRLIHFSPDDSVILMSPPVPGTENFATETLNTLYEYDIDVTVFTKEVLKSTHASGEDIKLSYSMLKPKFIMPIKGESRHLVQHLDIALDYGYPKDKVLVLENGDFVNFEDGNLKEIEKIHLNDILVDGNISNIDSKVIKERETLAEEGVLIVSTLIDVDNKKILTDINIFKKGFVENQNSNSEITTDTRIIEVVKGILNNNLQKKKFDLETVKANITEETSKIIFRFERKRPIVIADISLKLPENEYLQLGKPEKIVSKNKNIKKKTNENKKENEIKINKKENKSNINQKKKPNNKKEEQTNNSQKKNIKKNYINDKKVNSKKDTKTNNSKKPKNNK